MAKHVKMVSGPSTRHTCYYGNNCTQLLSSLPHPPPPSLSLTAVVVFGFIDGDEEGKEETEVIEVTITRSIPTAADISFTISPLEFSDSFDLPIENDPGPDSPAIATRMNGLVYTLIIVPNYGYIHYVYTQTACSITYVGK